MQEIIPCSNLYFIKSLNLTFALKAKENICTSIIRELNDSIKDVSIIFKFKDKSKFCILFIPLDISNIPVIIAFNVWDIFKLLKTTSGTRENITVYANMNASVFKVP